jgi:hypothetical protein
VGTWGRGWATEQAWAVGQFKVESIPNGHTLARVHFGYRWVGITSNDASYETLADDFLAVGVVTQNSSRGSTAPNALSQAQDVNAPLERWLHWATVGMRPRVMGSEHPDTMLWETDVSRETLDSKGQVIASVGAGNTLDVYISWAPWSTTAWATQGTARGQMWASVLYD